MTIILNDPSWWSLIDIRRSYSYYIVEATTMVVYDWVLTIGKEVDLIWRQRWSFMTLLYFSMRYIHSIILCHRDNGGSPGSPTDRHGTIIFKICGWASVILNAMLEVIMIARLYAMYQQSRRILIFLIVTFLAVFRDKLCVRGGVYSVRDL
ncbi:hypothetical protein K503DRAFT_115461 [Rhizopogon vinicolor AM-OR11-026]|uniref:DUF6533 domain-containing protein n=1 Tax=Rhizopogon vinicolor AM-OR11-026 TaxID=1314800 RepID=A0A1B7MEV7_9AGAM|nr:hypothetical protein K503DRAFT_115461 [Rhizopogon vinicolor AM-OR11-026]